MSPRGRFRFRRYVIVGDPTGLPTYDATCVTHRDPDDEDAPECGETSGELAVPADIDRWIAEHVRDTGHIRYQRVSREYAVAEAGEWR